MLLTHLMYVLQSKSDLDLIADVMSLAYLLQHPKHVDFIVFIYCLKQLILFQEH